MHFFRILDNLQNGNDGMDQTQATQSSSTHKQTFSRRKRLKTALEGYLYLAPTLIILAVFVYVPVITSFNLSLNRIAPFGNQMRFVGTDNYTSLLTDPDYWNSILVTLVFTAGIVLVGITLALLLAVALAQPVRRLSGLHRLLFFLPVVISGAVAGIIFNWLYHPVVGYLNYWLTFLNIEGPNWLNDKDWALIAVMLAAMWRQLGFNVIIALAGLQNIDTVFYDAAKVDGANSWQRFRNVTLPLLSPTLFFLLIINVIISFQTFSEIHVLTQGGPGQGTNTLIYSIFSDAFVGTPQRGIASAQAYLLAIIIIVLSLFQFRGLSRRVHYQ